MRQQTCVLFISVTLLLGSCFQVHGQRVDRHQPFRTPNKRYELRSAVWKLRTVKEVSSATPGWSPPGEFFKLSEELLRYGNEGEFKKLLEDENPIVKVMGLVCLAQLDFEKHSPILRAHAIDQEVVVLHDQCLVSNIRVGQIAKMLLENPNFLGHKTTSTLVKKAVQN